MALQADEHIKQVGDAVSILTVVGTLAELLPAIAAILTIVWTAIRIWEQIPFNVCLNVTRGIKMPMVANKKFPYTAKGKKAAEEYASKKAKKMHEKKESKAMKAKEKKMGYPS
jgi:hypothetical protein